MMNKTMNKTTKRLSKMVTSSMDLSNPDGRNSIRRPFGGKEKDAIMDMSESEHSTSSKNSDDRYSFSWTRKKKDRKSFPAQPTGSIPESQGGIPRPNNIRRQVSYESGLEKKQKEIDEEEEYTAELKEMEDFLTQLEGMDKHKVHEILQAEKELQKRDTSDSHSNHSSNHSETSELEPEPEPEEQQEICKRKGMSFAGFLPMGNNSTRKNNTGAVDELGGKSLHSSQKKRANSPKRFL